MSLADWKFLTAESVAGPKWPFGVAERNPAFIKYCWRRMIGPFGVVSVIPYTRSDWSERHVAAWTGTIKKVVEISRIIDRMIGEHKIYLMDERIFMV